MINITKFNSTEGLKELNLKDLTKWDNKSGDNLWIDLWEENEETNIKILKDIFNFHPLAIEDCLKYIKEDTVHYPKIDDYDDYLFIVFNGISKDIPDYSTFSLSCFVGNNYIITVHNEKDKNTILENLYVKSRETLLKKGPDYTLHIILDELVDRYYPLIDHLEDNIDKIEEDIFEKNPDNKLLHNILDFKKSLLNVRKITSFQKEILFRLSRGDFEIIEDRETIYYRNVYDHLVRISDTAESLRELLSSILDSYLSIINNRMNDIIKVLTVFATIILPLNFITGLYGMNFDNIPLRNSQYGFIITSVIMILVVIFMLFWFRRKKWI
jgi:magnesium transporter